MNEAHLQFCSSDDWRSMIEHDVMPVVVGELDLGDDVLEIGPGPGFTTDVLRRSVPRLTAVELDPVLATRLAERLIGTNVDVIRGDATDTHLAADRFSAATSFNMLHHVPTRELQNAIFAELHRVLRPGGLLVAADGVYDEATVAFHEGDIYNPIDPAELESRLSTAGFRDIEIGRFVFGWMCRARAAA